MPLFKHFLYVSSCLFVLVCSSAFAANPLPITDWAVQPVGTTKILPAPDKEGGKPLMQALALRKSVRNFSSEALPDQELSNLLWAIFGVNRPNGTRTAPTANNKREVLVYAALPGGVWLYDGVKHSLEKKSDADLRDKLSNAPLVLIYGAKDDNFGGMHVGSLYQNAGLYCASADLGNVVKASDLPMLSEALPVPSGYKLYITQVVGRMK